MPTYHTHPHRTTNAAAFLGLVALLVLLFGVGGAGMSQPAATVPPQGITPIADTYYAAGEWIDVPAPVLRDVVAAGRSISIRHEVRGDILAAGARVTLTATANDDVRIVGRDVRVDAPVGGDLTLAGQDVTVGPGTHVTGRTWLAGQTVQADGTFERELRIAGAMVRIGGEVRQPVTVIAERLEVLSGARILAPLTYKGRTAATIARGALLSHPIAYEPLPEPARSSRGPTSVLFALHLLAAGMLLLFFVPRIATAPAEILAAQTGRSLLLGIVLFVTLPFMALLLLITLIGIPIGLTLGAGYLIALFVGVLTAAFFVGNVEAKAFHRWPLTTRSRQAAFFAAGVITLAILRAVPVVGSLVVFAAIVSGLGAFALWGYRTYVPPTAPSPAT